MRRERMKPNGVVTCFTCLRFAQVYRDASRWQSCIQLQTRGLKWHAQNLRTLHSLTRQIQVSHLPNLFMQDETEHEPSRRTGGLYIRV